MVRPLRLAADEEWCCHTAAGAALEALTARLARALWVACGYSHCRRAWRSKVKLTLGLAGISIRSTAMARKVATCPFGLSMHHRWPRFFGKQPGFIEDPAQCFEVLWVVDRQEWWPHVSPRLVQHVHACLDLRLRRAKCAAPIWADQPRHKGHVATGRMLSRHKVIAPERFVEFHGEFCAEATTINIAITADVTQH